MTSKDARPIKERLQKLINRANGCWEWTGRITYQGYGQICVGSRTDNSRRNRQAHIVSYETFVGEVPKGLELDHTCRNKRCINPDHLEAVTHSVNMKRAIYKAGKRPGAIFNLNKTECKWGHPLDYIYPNGKKRGCTTCRRAISKSWQLARKAG